MNNKLTDYLQRMIAQGASDLYLCTDACPNVRINGKLTTLDYTQLSAEDMQSIAYYVMSTEQAAEFETEYEMNLALAKTGIGRFRVNIFRQRGKISMVVRHIPGEIFTLQSLVLPDVLKKLVLLKRGLILFVGATGEGKSTSLAALINYRNAFSTGHIITVEDPIEFVHTNKKSLVNQREVGVDTRSYASALKNTLRQSPDVILIGEIRDKETMEHALAFAETGHLCLSTLHANNANQALDRILGFFPVSQHQQLLTDVSQTMRAIVSQRLVNTLDNQRIAAFEILLNTPYVKGLIQQGDIDGLKRAMERSEPAGMQTFDSTLLQLYKAQRISAEEALKHADSPSNLRVRMALSSEVESTGHSQLAIQTERNGGNN